jgi:hypothetical protein
VCKQFQIDYPEAKGMQFHLNKAGMQYAFGIIFFFKENDLKFSKITLGAL